MRLERLPGLDGLRAMAVVAVLLYHAGLLQGGFLGVDVFFVISGFLITGLLLAEWRAEGRIDVPAFWLRRARRLLPAVFALLAGVLAFAVLVLPAEVASLRSAALAAFAYVTNWYLVLGHQSYFEAIGRPSPLRHLWSLAVEEQFYVVWPLLLGLSLAFFRRRATLAVILVGAALSAVWMAALFVPDTDPSRIYYGTDTRLTGLLLGSALAFVWPPKRRPLPDDWLGRRAAAARRRRAWAVDATGLAGLAVVAAFFVLLDEYSPFLYLGGFGLLALVTAGVVGAAVHPDGRLGPKLLDRQPLRWIGQRSYSIYLWHWPVYMLTRPGLDVALSAPADLVLRLALTLGLAELSYRVVEMPIRRGALGRAWRSWREASGERRRQAYRWMLPAATVLGVLVVALGADVVGAGTPPPPAYLAAGAIDRIVSSPGPSGGPSNGPAGPGVAALPTAILPQASPGGHALVVRAVASATASASVAGAGSAPSAAASGDAAGAIGSLPTAAPHGRVLAIGDSVMLGAASALGAEISDLEVNAAVGRFWVDGEAILRARAAAGTLPSIVIIDLGNNERLFEPQFDELMQLLRHVPRVIVVNLRVPQPWQERDNLTLDFGVRRYPNAVLVDWFRASEGHPELFWGDGLHLRPAGAQLYARLIAAAIR